MHPVGDVPDGIFFRRYSRPDIAFHARCDSAVHAAHAVVKARPAQGEGGLIESAVIAGAGAKLQKAYGYRPSAP